MFFEFWIHSDHCHFVIQIMTWHHHPTFCLQREIMFLEWSCVEFIQRSKSIQKNSPSSLSYSSFNSNESCFMTSFILQSYPHLQIFKAHHLRRQWGQLLQKLGLRFHSRRRTHRRRPPSSSAPGCRVQLCRTGIFWMFLVWRELNSPARCAGGSRPQSLIWGTWKQA